jgi:uncharacterized membrane protein YagU involved in acid resistance
MPKKTKINKKIFIIAVISLITGTLQAIALLIIGPHSPETLFRYIASGYYNQEAFTEDNMVLWGILFHYLIATAFSAGFWGIYPKFWKSIKNKYRIGLIFGLMIWIIMTFAVLPLTSVAKKPESPSIDIVMNLKNIIASIICVGMPAAIISDDYYRRKAKRADRRRVRNHYS